MIKKCLLSIAVAASVVTITTGAFAAGGHIEIPRNEWSFSGIGGQYDKAQLQRGFQVYREACSSCHGMNRIAFRNLAQSGGPEFPEEELKALAAEYEVDALPNDDGEVSKRPAVLSDKFPLLYANEQEARSIHNGALPPDLSVIAKARGTAYSGSWYWHPFAMLSDIFNAYQEGGADYIVAVLTGYKEPPDDMEMSVGMNYNKYYPGHQIAMANPFAGGDNQIEYQSTAIPSTVKQYAKDVAAFLSWTSDPTLNQRKQTGWQVLIYLLITAVLLYIAKRRVWASVKH
ncbi:MAG: Cytochrome b/c1 [Hyphomicrobiaceae bacterium hypho_1]